jgi:hypothetical protein
MLHLDMLHGESAGPDDASLKAKEAGSKSQIVVF